MNQDYDPTISIELFEVYNQIKLRKLKQIEYIESVLVPILSEHPEVKGVLDIIEKWKPKTGQIKHESSHLPKS